LRHDLKAALPGPGKAALVFDAHAIIPTRAFQNATTFSSSGTKTGGPHKTLPTLRLRPFPGKAAQLDRAKGENPRHHPGTAEPQLGKNSPNLEKSSKGKGKTQ